jgi:hypothetical protein
MMDKLPQISRMPQKRTPAYLRNQRYLRENKIAGKTIRRLYALPAKKSVFITVKYPADQIIKMSTRIEQFVQFVSIRVIKQNK